MVVPHFSAFNDPDFVPGKFCTKGESSMYYWKDTGSSSLKPPVKHTVGMVMYPVQGGGMYYVRTKGKLAFRFTLMLQGTLKTELSEMPVKASDTSFHFQDLTLRKGWRSEERRVGKEC